MTLNNNGSALHKPVNQALGLQIGPIKVYPPVILAPMAGYTDSTFRTICLKHKCGLVFTEVVSSEGIARRNIRSLNLLFTAADEEPIAAHIYGNNPDVMACAAIEVERLNRFSFIDINAGCPVPKIVRKGSGVALMNDPQLVYRIVKTVVEAVSLPVTVKSRTGISKDNPNIDEVAHAAEEAGASALFLHARLASQGHRGSVDMETLAKIKHDLSIPVIGNGGIDSPQAAVDMLTQTKVDGVMIGKAAIGNPWIFEEISSELSGDPYRASKPEDYLQVIEAHLLGLHDLMSQFNNKRKRPRPYPEQAACHRFRGHLAKYLRQAGYPAHLRREILQQEKIEPLLNLTRKALLKEK
jgi:tRNA-dihydrouridine synthase B